MMILLDIPQGAITIASAILVAFAGAILTLAIWVFRLLYSIQGRLSALESSVNGLQAADFQRRVSALEPQMAIFWQAFRNVQIPNLPGIPAPGNPMKQERWDELAEKLHREEISEEEAREFLAALLEKREQAIREKDPATLVIVGAGIAFTQWRLGETEWQLQQKEKELREQK